MGEEGSFFEKNDTLQYPERPKSIKVLEGYQLKTEFDFEGLFQEVPNLFLTVEDTKFARFLEESFQIIEKHPRILEQIEADQTAHAKQKKHMRLRDKRWERNQQAKLEGVEHGEESLPEPGELDLKEGRPRTKPVVVYILLVVRGYLGGVSTEEFQNFVAESRTLKVVFENLGEPLPARSTMSENLNCVSNETRREILVCQLTEVSQERLDDFQEITTDTTGVWADTAFPTDASILVKLAERLWNQASGFEELDDSLRNYTRHWTEYWLGTMRKCQYEIQFADHNGTYKKWYRRLYEQAKKIQEHLEQEAQAFEDRFSPEEYRPSKRKKIQKRQRQIRSDLTDLKQVIEYSRDRVLEGKSTPASEKVLSMGDPDASWIEKGGQQPVVGFRPRVTRSGKGFVTELNVPVGNPSDSTQLMEAVEVHEANTGVLPRTISADDGFANKTQRDALQQRDSIEAVCITGTRGKRMTPDKQWESESYQRMRRKRSAVESLIFSLKDGFSFGQLARRGIQAVRAELLEDVIAYNFCHILRVRERNQEEKIPRAA